MNIKGNNFITATLFVLFLVITFDACALPSRTHVGHGFFQNVQNAMNACNDSYGAYCSLSGHWVSPKCVNSSALDTVYVTPGNVMHHFYSCPSGFVTSVACQVQTDGSCTLTPVNEYPKTAGHLCGSKSVFGNPCNASNGNKYQLETDYNGANTGLTFNRHYNSGSSSVDSGLGFGWTHQLASALEVSNNQITIHQADGRSEVFSGSSGIWQGDADTHLVLTEDSTGFTLVSDAGITERYDLTGNLLNQNDLVGRQTTYTYNSNNQIDTITGPYGHTLSFTYNANNRIDILTDPDGQQYRYQYDSAGNLVKVTYPDTTFKLYHYENVRFPTALTGISDENGDRFATYAYDAVGRAVVTEHAITSNTTPQKHFDLSYDSTARLPSPLRWAPLKY